MINENDFQVQDDMEHETRILEINQPVQNEREPVKYETQILEINQPVQSCQEPQGEIEYKTQMLEMNQLVQSEAPNKKEKAPKEKRQPDRHESKGFWGSLFGKKKENAEDEDATIVEDEEVTWVLDPVSQAVTVKCLELIESETEGAIGRIPLNFTNAYITLGRLSQNAVNPDVCFSERFRQISRMHLRIERNGDSYYAIDLESGNHTMLDGQMMMPNVRYKLQAGMILSIAANRMPVKYRVNI